MQVFAKRVLDEAYRRMIRTEVRRVSTHAQHPKHFLDKVDNFYDAFATELRDAIRTGCDGVFGDNAESTAWLIAQNHCQQSRDQILDACDCQPEQLTEQVQAVTHTWHQRRVDVDTYTNFLHSE